MADPISKLEALRRREQSLKSRIAEEKVRQQRQKEKDDGRLFTIVGEALVHYAEKSPDFRLMLSQVLQSSELRDTDRAFLALKGWL